MKKCRRCGHRIDTDSVFCSKCGAKQTVGKYAKPQSPKARKGPIILLIAILAAITAALCLFLLPGAEPGAAAPPHSEVKVLIPEKMGTAPEDVCFEEGELFADSQLLLTVRAGTDYAAVEALVRKDQGVIIGHISFSGDYHIDFPEGKTYEELTEILKKWQDAEIVETAEFNRVFRIDTASVDYTKDPWGAMIFPEGWNEAAPSGGNWWAEALCMPSVWGSDLWGRVDKGTVPVGVIDSVFAEDHEDLDGVIAKTWQNTFDPDALDSEALSHGTHVSGIIAAELGNGVGIAGVAACVEPQLYGFAMHGQSNETYFGSMDYKYAIALLLEEGVEIINISMGLGDVMIFAAEKGVPRARATVNYHNESIEAFLEDALEAGFDPLIVKAAGNTSNDRFVECDVSKDHPYGYRKVSSDESSGTVSSSCSSKWDLFSGIPEGTVRDRIIVVGAARQAGDAYQATDFSNRDVDVYAPGYNILSLAYGQKDTVSYPGTSQATPMVTGIATLLKAIEPDLSAVQLKEIILKSVPNVSGPDRVGIVNAAVAVYWAQNWSGFGIEHEQSSALLGTVYEMTDPGGQASIPGAEISVYARRDPAPVKQLQSERFGEFSCFLPAGDYDLTVTAPGYIPRTVTFRLEEEDTLYLSVELEPSKLTQAVAYRSTSREQTDLTYDSDGRLTRISSHGDVQKMFRYGSDGRLSGWTVREDLAETDYLCVHDAQGNRIREYTADGDRETVYTYDSSGRPVSCISSILYGDMRISRETTFLYDGAGRLSTEITEEDTGYGASATQRKEYSYDHAPFLSVDVYSDNTLMYSELIYEDTSSGARLSFTVDDTARFEYGMGQLTKITGEGYTYLFFYDGEHGSEPQIPLPEEPSEDLFTGDYMCDGADIRISITQVGSDRFLTYTASGVVLEDIPLIYADEESATYKKLIFDVDTAYPEYPGSIQFIWEEGQGYRFSASIEGLDDTEGDYYPLTKLGEYTPAE